MTMERIARRPNPYFSKLNKFISWRLPAALLTGVILAAVFAPLITPHDPYELDPSIRLLPVSAEHWLGTDAFGRDVLSRAIVGGRISLGIGFLVGFASMVIGLFLGMIAAQNVVAEAVVMRTMDGLMAIPSILLAIALVAVLGGSFLTVAIAVTIVEVPRVTRLVHSLIIGLRKLAYIEAAQIAGTSMPVLMVRHVLPNIVGPLIVQATFIVASAILIEAYLSFLGVGTPVEIPSWGNMIADGRRYVMVSLSTVLYPSIFLGLTIFSINLLGDRLRDWFDPMMTQRL